MVREDEVLTPAPRLTTVERVRWALKVPAGGPWLPGGEQEQRLIEVIAAAEAHIAATVDPFEVATVAESRLYRSFRSGYVLTDRFPEFPEVVEMSGSREGPWTVVHGWAAEIPPTTRRPGRDLCVDAVPVYSWVRVTGLFGWAEIPEDVAQAATLMSARMFPGLSAPAAALGDNVSALLAPYRTLV